MLDVDADRDSADVRCEDRRQNYRLGDLLSHKFFQMEQRPEDRMHFYCDHCNRSLGCELARRYASSEAARRAPPEAELAALAGMVEDRLRVRGFERPPPDALVLRLRLGDAIDLKQALYKRNTGGGDGTASRCWHQCGGGGCEYNECGCALERQLARAARVDPPLRRTVILAASKRHVGHIRGGVPSTSDAYLQRVRGLLRRTGFANVSVRADTGPDADFVFGSAARVLMPGGGGYGQRMAQVAARLGGLLLCPQGVERRGSPVEDATAATCLSTFRSSMYLSYVKELGCTNP